MFTESAVLPVFRSAPLAMSSGALRSGQDLVKLQLRVFTVTVIITMVTIWNGWFLEVSFWGNRWRLGIKIFLINVLGFVSAFVGNILGGGIGSGEPLLALGSGSGSNA